jgi:hypothetical protein
MVPPCANPVVATARTWCRSGESQHNPFSAEAAEFVPSWKRVQESPPSQGNCCLISLGAYSDDSDEEEPYFSRQLVASSEAKVTTAASSHPWRVAAAEFVPHGSSTDEQNKATNEDSGTALGQPVISLDAYSDGSDEDVQASPAAKDSVMPVSSRPWRVAAAEFVPAKRDTDESCSNTCSSGNHGISGEKDSLPVEEAATTSAQSSEKVKQSPWRSQAKTLPWRRASSPSTVEDAEEISVITTGSDTDTSPSAAACPSEKIISPISTQSTSEGSSFAASVDENSSDSCGSRSQSPRTSQPEDYGSVSLSALLKWRCVVGPERPEDQLTSASEPKSGTVEAAIASFVAKLAASPTTPSPIKTPSSPIQTLLSQQASPDRARISKDSWRRTVPVKEEECWRNVSPQKELEISQESWVAKQRARRGDQHQGSSDSADDEQMARTIKSLLNKLTIEKFEKISEQIFQCGIRNAVHVELLIHEVFEKATTQHHFIAMYADLCELLNKHLADIFEDPKKTFKKILLNCCQLSFEKNLTPPAGLAELGSEERAEREILYKMRMLGNIRFVGALFVRKLVASKVMLSIMEVLLQDPTPEALESLAAFLIAIGPTFDTPDWAYATTLNAVFAQVEKLTKRKTVPKRVRYLLNDVLDLRSTGWNDRRPKKIEGPLKLEQVAAKAAMENGGSCDATKPNENDWEVVSGARLSKLLTPGVSNPVSHTTVGYAAKQQGSIHVPQKAEKTTRNTNAGQFMLEFLRSRDKQESPKNNEETQKTNFDKDACRAEVSATLAELCVSHDVSEAIARIANIGIPASSQVSEFSEVLVRIVEEGAESSRRVGFDLVAGLFLKGHWQRESAVKGIQSFVEDTCPDLKYDVPTLPKILRDELFLALNPLVTAKILDGDQLDTLLTV